LRGVFGFFRFRRQVAVDVEGVSLEDRPQRLLGEVLDGNAPLKLLSSSFRLMLSKATLVGVAATRLTSSTLLRLPGAIAGSVWPMLSTNFARSNWAIEMPPVICGSCRGRWLSAHPGRATGWQRS
jgi:hypothetical protein